MAVRAGGLILEANREYAKGRFTEALPLYEEALCMELDSRTRFVVLRNQGRCLLYTSPSPRDATLSRMPSSA